MQENKQLKQQQNQAQDGRSMVEMLGVLAIIGVISLGGIAGYKMAMDRYQANQIANEINLMRNDMKMKVAQGADLFLGEPYDNDGEELGHLSFNEKYKVDFGFNNATEEEEETEDEYFISVSNISEGVCKPLVTLLDSMEDTDDIKVNEVDYYDTDWNICASENKIEVAFSTTDLGVVNNDEEDEPMTTAVTFTTTTATPTTPTPTTPTATTPMPTTPMPTTPTTTTPTLTTATTTTSKPLTTTTQKKCTKNEDCGNNQYCETFMCSDGIELPCKSYSCKDIGTPKEVKVGETTYYYKDTNMNWWSAERYCQALKAQGKGTGQMLTLEELGCPKTTELTKCSDDADALWKKLNEAGITTNCYYTKTPYGSNSNNTTYVYYVCFKEGTVFNCNRNISGKPLCK